MKSYMLLQLLLLSIAPPVLAQDMRSCEAQSAQLKENERNAFLKSCLAQASTPANVQKTSQQDKLHFCEQNAKNMSMQGTERSSYIKTCMNSNEAEAAARKTTVKEAAPQTRESTCASSDKATRSARKSARQQKKADIAC
ncbi:MAG TPA: hypothetical protein VEP71_00130 [Gallionella sp.]|nr:hypothetical protein [Gallionella sp.]